MHFKFALISSLALAVLAIAFASDKLSVSTHAQQTVGSTPSSGPNSLLFRLSGSDLAYAKSLRASDLRLTVNNQPGEIVALESLGEQPLSLAILIDTSMSQRRTFQGQKLAADLFLQMMLRPGIDQGALVSFTNDATIEQGLTNDIGVLRNALARVKVTVPSGYVGGGVLVTDPSVLGLPKNDGRVAGSTAIWDAVWATSEDLFGALPTSRKAMVILSDGADTASRTKMREAVERAVKAGVAVYAIGIGDPDFGVAEDNLSKLSSRTGGHAFFPNKIKDLEGIFAEIAQHLRSQYKITYKLPPGYTGPTDKLKLELINPEHRGKKINLSYQR
ncbi:MAG TPA: VWA domain-containing protein [Pyrinomonadaceae bacterium]|nr:VWA domain-containing protein [Pyrinomonadaceae bacterium]